MEPPREGFCFHRVAHVRGCHSILFRSPRMKGVCIAIATKCDVSSQRNEKWQRNDAEEMDRKSAENPLPEIAKKKQKKLLNLHVYILLLLYASH